MNKNLIQIGKNQYQVINDKGETYFTVANNEGSKEILIKENELENSINRLNFDKGKLQSNSIRNTIANITMYGMMPVFFIALYTYTTFIPAILLTILAYCPYKVLHSMCFGTRSKRKREKKKLNHEIKKLEANIPELEKTIANLKKELEFKKYQIKDINHNDNTVTIVNTYPHITSYYEDTKPKVLSIGQKKNEK